MTVSGERIRATPGRFALRPIGEGARVEASSEGWTVSGGSLRFAYELVDRQTGAVVHRDSVAMTCTRGTPAEEAAPRSIGNALSGFPIERVLSGGTSEHTGRCGGDRAPEHVYTLDIDRPMWLSTRRSTCATREATSSTAAWSAVSRERSGCRARGRSSRPAPTTW